MRKVSIFECYISRVGPDGLTPGEAQSIHLYQRITEVLETLVNRVDEEMETRMRGFDQRVREAGDNLNSLKPSVGQLHDGLAELQEMLSDQLKQTAEASFRVECHASYS